MPTHHGSRSDQDERLRPPGPERSQCDPKQLVQGSQSTARSFGVQGQQLLTESEVFEDEILPGTGSSTPGFPTTAWAPSEETTMTFEPSPRMGSSCCTRKNGLRTFVAKRLSKSSTV